MAKQKKSEKKSTSLKVLNKAQNKLNKQKQRDKKQRNSLKKASAILKLDRDKNGKSHLNEEDEELAKGSSFVRDFFEDDENASDYEHKLYASVYIFL